MYLAHWEKKKLSKLKRLRQPASADFLYELKQQVDNTQKSAEAGCLKLCEFAELFFFFFSAWKITFIQMGYKQEVSKDTLLIREAHIFFILCWLLCSFKLN